MNKREKANDAPVDVNGKTELGMPAVDVPGEHFPEEDPDDSRPTLDLTDQVSNSQAYEVPFDQMKTRIPPKLKKEEVDVHRPTVEVGTINPEELQPVKVVSDSLMPMPSAAPRMASVPPSINTGAEAAEHFGIITRPVAYITDEHGNITSEEPLPLFTRYQTDRVRENYPKIEAGPETEIFSIGTNICDDIYLERSENLCIEGTHALIKVERGRTWIRSKQGPVKIDGKMAPASEWTEFTRDDVIQIVPKIPKDRQGPRDPRFRHIKIDPTYQNIEEDDRRVMGMVVCHRANELEKKLQQVLNEHLDLARIDVDEEASKKRAEKAAQAEEIYHLLSEIIDYDAVHRLFALRQSPDFYFAYAQRALATKEPIKAILEDVFIREQALGKIDKAKENDRKRRQAKIENRRVQEQVAALHVLDSEDPEDKEQVPHIFRCPVFTIQKNSDKKSNPIPMLAPKLIFGTDEVCHVQLEQTGSGSERDKKHVAPFMAELFYEEEGGIRIFYVKYLHPNVLLASTEGERKRVPPPRETFEVTDGTTVYIGGYQVEISEKLHGFSYAKIEREINQTIDKLFGRIKNQTVTTQSEDSEAHDHLIALYKEIQASKLPPTIKRVIRRKYLNHYSAIINGLMGKVEHGWDEHNPVSDSGYFQTLDMLMSVMKNNPCFEKHNEPNDAVAYEIKFMMQPWILEREAQRRLQVYSGFMLDPTSKMGKLALALSSKRRQEKEAENKERRKKALAGAVETVRLIEFGLLSKADIQGYGEFTKRIQKVFHIREYFNKVGAGEASLREIIELDKRCNDLAMKDIFAPEEIVSRNQHIEVDMKPEEKARNYVKKMAIFQARKAFKRLEEIHEELRVDSTRERTEENGQINVDIINRIHADAELINGLCRAGIMKKYELIDSIANLKTEKEINEAIERRNEILEENISWAKRKEQANKKKQEAEKRLEHDIEQAVKNAALLQSQILRLRKGITFELFKDMVGLAGVALNPATKKIMADPIYDLHVEEKVYEEGEVKAKATPTRLNWHIYFEEWEAIFQQAGKVFAEQAGNGGQKARDMVGLLNYCVKAGYLQEEQIGLSIDQMYRGIAGLEYKETAFRAGLTNFDYLQNLPEKHIKEPEDKAFFERMRDEITSAKLKEMVKQYQQGSENDKKRYRLKIRVLQMKDPRATVLLQSMNLSTEELQDLSQ